MPLINISGHDTRYRLVDDDSAHRYKANRRPRVPEEEKRPQRYDRSYSHSEKSGPFQMATKTFRCEK